MRLKAEDINPQPFVPLIGLFYGRERKKEAI